MRDVSNTTGPVSYGETSWEAGDTPEAVTGKSAYQELICQANTVPLTIVFKHYNVRVDGGKSNVICPLKSHQGGRERTGSFRFYPATNSFYCHGCKVGGSNSHACEFIAAMDNVSKEKAARKILTIFREDVNFDAIDESATENFSETFQMMMDFSNAVREFRQTHFDEKARKHIEFVCMVYDKANLKRKLNNEALRRIVDELLDQIKNYKP